MSKEIIWDDFSVKKPDRDLGLEVEKFGFGTKIIFWVSRKDLADSSPIFEKMLFGQFKESQMEIIQLPEKLDQDILEFLRCLFPTGTERKAVDKFNVDPLLSLADEYQIEKLTEECSKFLMTEIDRVKTEGEMVDFFVTGVRYKLKELVHRSIWAARKFSVRSILGFAQMSAEVRNAITMQVPPRENNHRRTLEVTTIGSREFVSYGNTCHTCKKEIGIFDETRKREGERPCPICHKCRLYIEGDKAPMSLCKCMHESVCEELKKVGLY